MSLCNQINIWRFWYQTKYKQMIQPWCWLFWEIIFRYPINERRCLQFEEHQVLIGTECSAYFPVLFMKYAGDGDGMLCDDVLICHAVAWLLVTGSGPRQPSRGTVTATGPPQEQVPGAQVRWPLHPGQQSNICRRQNIIYEVWGLDAGQFCWWRSQPNHFPL